MPDAEVKKPVLFIFSGLPGSGKSTLARAVARHFAAAYVRIDTIEQALRDLSRSMYRAKATNWPAELRPTVCDWELAPLPILAIRLNGRGGRGNK